MNAGVGLALHAAAHGGVHASTAASEPVISASQAEQRLLDTEAQRGNALAALQVGVVLMLLMAALWAATEIWSSRSKK